MNSATDHSAAELLELYGNFLLENGRRPRNMYLFAKEIGWEESEIYAYYTSTEQMEEAILEHLFRSSVAVTQQELHPETPTREKLLNVYYVFFENMSLNRSLVMLLLERSFGLNPQILRSLRRAFVDYARTLDLDTPSFLEKAPRRWQDIRERWQVEALWAHLVSAVDFWKHDTSARFQDTDLYLEKTIDTASELLRTEPLDKLFDLGKFLVQRRHR